MIKEALSVLAIALTFYGFYPYIRSIRLGEFKPHVFSWIIWATTTLIVFFAQLEGGGGVGAWPTGVSAVITCYVAYLAYKNLGDIKNYSTRLGVFYNSHVILTILVYHIRSVMGRYYLNNS
jgi:hypothetical protein